MSKQSNEPPRKQEPETEWLTFAVRKVPGTYEKAGGWVLRVGTLPEGKLPTERIDEPNLLAVVLGNIESRVLHHRDYET